MKNPGSIILQINGSASLKCYILINYLKIIKQQRAHRRAAENSLWLQRFRGLAGDTDTVLGRKEVFRYILSQGLHLITII